MKYGARNRIIAKVESVKKGDVVSLMAGRCGHRGRPAN
jgi:hypothetical protein